MPARKTKAIPWRAGVEEHDYLAAVSYLSLLYPAKRVAKMAAKFRNARLMQFKAKDIFRASQLSLLGVSNSHVDRDREKIRAGVALSPILLVRDERVPKTIIADGYHRLCAVYSLDEDALIPCKIIQSA